MTKAEPDLDHAFQSELQNLATTLRPGTVADYRCILQAFLKFLHTSFPELRRCSQLRRNPHIIAWLRSLLQHQPPLTNCTREKHIISVRRVLVDLQLDGHAPPQPLFHRGDLPPRDLYLPKPLSPEDDTRLQEQLRKMNDLRANALLLMRTTGIRIGEGLALDIDSLRHLGGPDWALRVPLGKLHNERWVPVDDDTREIFTRILELRIPPHDVQSGNLLLRQKNGRPPSYTAMRSTLDKATDNAGCSTHVHPHQLRHTYATTLLRAGVGILALMKLLGHRSVAMTMRYVQVSQIDLQREYHQAREKMASLYVIPKITEHLNGIPAICETIREARHRIEMYRRHLRDCTVQGRLRRIDKRLFRILNRLKSLGE